MWTSCAIYEVGVQACLAICGKAVGTWNVQVARCIVQYMMHV